MTTVKTSEMLPPALDWAVAKAEGRLAEPWLWGDEQEVLRRYKFSTNWAQGGPIIEREFINVMHTTRDLGEWRACVKSQHRYGLGPTPLIAAMRAYVAYKLGSEVDVPEELLS